MVVYMNDLATLQPCTPGPEPSTVVSAAAALEQELSQLQESLQSMSVALEVENKDSERAQHLRDDLDRLDAGGCRVACVCWSCARQVTTEAMEQHTERTTHVPADSCGDRACCPPAYSSDNITSVCLQACTLQLLAFPPSRAVFDTCFQTGLNTAMLLMLSVRRVCRD